MEHNYHLAGAAFGLRPVAFADVPLIIQLRSDPQRCRFLHPIELNIDSQRRYLQRYFERADDYYFVIENAHTRQPEGLIGLYDIDRGARHGEWGRWILRSGSLAAPESVLLMLQFGLEICQLQAVSSMTVADNQPVISFHDACGAKRTGLYCAKYDLAAGKFDAVQHTVTRESWPAVRARLAAQSDRIATRLAGGRSRAQ